MLLLILKNYLEWLYKILISFKRTDYKGTTKLAPQFTKTPMSVVVSKGDTACFCARVQCGKPMEIAWTMNGKDVKENPRCKVRRTISNNFEISLRTYFIKPSSFHRSRKTTAWVFSGYTTCNLETLARFGAQHLWVEKGRRSVARPSWDWIEQRGIPTRIRFNSKEIEMRNRPIAATLYEKRGRTFLPSSSLLREPRGRPRYLEDPRRVPTCPLCPWGGTSLEARCYSTREGRNWPRRGKIWVRKNSRAKLRNGCTGNRAIECRRTKRRRGRRRSRGGDVAKRRSPSCWRTKGKRW